MKLNSILVEILEGICARKDGEGDNEFLQRCGNALMRSPDMIDKVPQPYQDKIKLQTKQISKAQPPSPFDTSVRDSDDKDGHHRKLNYHDGDEFGQPTEDDEDLDEDGLPAGAGLSLPGGYINGAPLEKNVKKLSKKLRKQEEDIVNDNEIDRNDMLLNKLVKKLLQHNKKENVLEAQTYNCPKCGHEWKGEDGGQDENICHKCGHNLFHVKEGDINKPSPKLRPEPHPTRHETEHPSYEKTAMKSMSNKFKSPTKK